MRIITLTITTSLSSHSLHIYKDKLKYKMQQTTTTTNNNNNKIVFCSSFLTQPLFKNSILLHNKFNAILKYYSYL
jgi:hypothetical protein